MARVPAATMEEGLAPSPHGHRRTAPLPRCLSASSVIAPEVRAPAMEEAEVALGEGAIAVKTMVVIH